MKVLLILSILLLTSCTSTNKKNSDKNPTENTKNISSGNFNFYKKALDSSDYYIQKKDYKMSLLFLRKALRENPNDFPLKDNIIAIEKRQAIELKKLWDESLIEEAYGSIYCANCAMEKWAYIVHQDLQNNIITEKALEKLLIYDSPTNQ